jgi:hypothetical protein
VGAGSWEEELAPKAPGVGSWWCRWRRRELELGVGAPEAPPGELGVEVSKAPGVVGSASNSFSVFLRLQFLLAVEARPSE